ncbi:MAG: DUF4215 domain-containing protein [Deltaproteobacteria bacterium]|nr:DUF4215 domain-containing protein [Deltaproteobacteria bacterium]
MSSRFSRGLCTVGRSVKVGVGGWIGALALVLVSHSSALANCAALGGSVVAGVCTLSSAVARLGAFSLTEPLRITGAGSIRVPEGQTLSLDILGDMTIDSPAGTGGRIVGDSTTPTGRGADISVTTSGNMLLQMNARITSEANANGKAQSSCATSRGGSVRLNAGGDVTTVKGSLVSTSSKCTAGEIDIAAAGAASVEGSVLAQSLLTGTPWGYPGGGPISIDAGCILAVQSAGVVSSKGVDQGADLVHLGGGCGVSLFGLVQSTGPGHVVPTNPPNRCNLNDRPHDTTIDPMACVEVWSGGSLLIDRTGARKGEINADTGQSGGTQIAWIDLFAVDDITILGQQSKYAVHANQFLTNGSGGLITVASTGGKIATSRAAIQGNVTANGGRGGVVTVEAEDAVNFGTATIQAKGSLAGFAPAGGTIAGRSFNDAVVGAPPGSLDAGGGVPANGSVILQGCGVPDVDYSGAVTPSVAVSPAQCGGAPTLPSYVTLPTCACNLVQPSIAATKTCTSATADGVTFTVNFNGTVCNDGNVDVTLTQMTDDQPVAGTNIFPSLSTTALSVNACATYSGSFITSSNPSTDTVNAEGEGANGSGHVSASASAICDPTVGCGNFMVEPALGETCDDGNTNPNDACNACAKNICGDGVQNPAAEQCDDGNTSDNDACKKNCKLNICGDKIVNPAAEQCDDGNKSNNDACKNNCTLSACGDGVRNPTTEKCDDGNTSNNDGCKNDCTKNTCGDGIVNFLAEQCDDGNKVNNDACRNNCTLPVCGDGIVSPGEQCDDLNTTSGDGCSATCQTEGVNPICGNGVKEAGETCDDGNTTSGDGCSATCQTETPNPVCGNGVKEASETCDDGNTTSGDGCSATCESEALPNCGNGVKDAGEVCDDGDTNNNDSCFNNCLGGNQGCTIGYWKNHENVWTAPYTTTSTVGSVFTMPTCAGVSQSCILGLATDTFLTALDYPGGDTLCDKAQLLIKQAVGGVLNGVHGNINYPVDNVANLATQVNTALASCDAATIITLQQTIDGYNNLHNNDVCATTTNP